MGRFGKVHTAGGRSISLMSVSTEADFGDMEFLVPKAGTYVVVQLDASQMVEPLKDPELAAAAQQLQTRKYIGYVYEVEELPMPFREDHICCIEFGCRGLCKDNEEECVDPTMCTPIFPATQHPLSRESLRPRPAFPFRDCYHYTSAAHAVRIPTGSYKLSEAVSLGDRDFMVDSLYFDEDDKRRRARKKAKGMTPPRNGEGHPSSMPSSATDAAVAGAACDEALIISAADIRPAHQSSDIDTSIRRSAWDGTVTDSGHREHESTAPSEPCAAASSASHSEASPRRSTATPPDFSVELGAPVTVDNSELEMPAARPARPQLSLQIPQVAPDPTAAERVSDTPLDTEDGDPPVNLCSSAVELMQMFLDPNPDEDRDLIPLVKVSLDLSEVSEVNDPAQFLEEVDQITQLIEDSRSRSQSLQSNSRGGTLSPQATSASMRRALESWVDLDIEAPEPAGRADIRQRGTNKFYRILESARLKLGSRVRLARQRCASFLRVAKALAVAPFAVRFPTRLHVD